MANGTTNTRFELELEFTNPYKRTRLFIQNGRAFFGRWVPLDVTLDGDEKQVTVQEGQEGQLDLLADQEYGDRTLWRVIAHVNKIDFPLEQVTPGLRLIVPKLAHVNAALLASQARAVALGETGEE